ncbi:MAG: aromatic amino acid lyase [Bacteroidetes bacterium]|nr:MAG: aromatic amino acid lyase [Bacteroidota bacterium]
MTNIGASELNLGGVYDILFNDKKLKISEHTVLEMKASFDFLKEISENKVVYGINTGLGPMAQYKIEPEEQLQLQYNLIRSHSSGSGSPLSPIHVKSAMVCRLNTLSQAHSGVHPDVANVIISMVNNDITPLIPSHGGVGASGDLVQLAHLALVVIGEGEVFYQNEKRPTKEIFEELNIKPLKVHLREGLGMINGTSVMSGIGLVNIIDSYRLMNWSILAASMINELVSSFSDHFSEELNEVKQHKGQHIIASAMRKSMDDSQLIRDRCDFLFDGTLKGNEYQQKIQEYYSLRCIPQILGPIHDTIQNAEEVLVSEVNSVSDNPVIDHKRRKVFHGGNFHGDYVSLEMDKLRLAIIKLSMLSERQTNYLMNDKLNGILPPFVNLGKKGFNLGMQGVQFTATSTVAENQSLGTSLYIHSIPNNNDNQDIVSMGANSALATDKVIENTFEIMAIEILTLVQAIEYLKIQDKLSSISREIYNDIRIIVPSFSEDTTKYKELANIKEYLKTKKLNLL